MVDYDDSDNDNGGNGKDSAQDSKRPLACPYFYANPILYEACSRTSLSRSCDVLQHIRRKHLQPLFCTRCGFVAKGSKPEAQEKELSEHCRQLPACNPQPAVRAPPGATPDQLTKIGGKPTPSADPPTTSIIANSDVVRKWYGIFINVAPGIALPQSPYRDESPHPLDHAILTYINQGGLRKVAEELAASVEPDGHWKAANGFAAPDLKDPAVERYQKEVERFKTWIGLAIAHFASWHRGMQQPQTQPERLARDHETFDQDQLDKLQRGANLDNNSGNRYQ